MFQNWGIEPKIEHYGCYVDLLSRAGFLEEAYRVVEAMHIKPNDAIWGAILGGCTIHKNVELGSRVAKKLMVGLDPDRAAGYLVPVSNMYATGMRWKDVADIREKVFEMGMKRFNSLPTSIVRPRSILPPRRQLTRTFNNFKITIICGFLTILVLRGYIGLNLTSSEHEAVSANLAEETSRVLGEIRSSSAENNENNQSQDSGTDPFHNTTVTYTLGPKITHWESERMGWIKKNPGLSNYIGGKPRTLLVTGSPPNPYDNLIGDHYLLKGMKNKIDYCRLHGIEIVYNMAHLDEELSGYWAKLPLLRRLVLSHPEVEWVWWLDSDAFFTDMLFEVPLGKYNGYNMVIHGYPDLLFEEKSWIAVNTGNFLLRNCQWSLDLLDAWAQMGLKGTIRDEEGKVLTKSLKQRPDFEADD